MNVVFRNHSSKGALLKDCFALNLQIAGKSLRPFDYFILNVFESHLIVSVWSLPLNDQGTLTDNYIIVNKNIFGKIINCKVTNSNLIFITSDSGTLSILRMNATGYHPTIHGWKIHKAEFELVYQTEIQGLGTNYKELGVLLAVDHRCASFLLGSLQSIISKYSLDSNDDEYICCLDETFTDLGLIWEAVYLSSNSEKIVLLNTGKDEREYCLTLLEDGNQYSPYFLPNGHIPLLLVPLPEIPDSFLAVTSKSIIFFNTDSLNENLEATKYVWLDFPNNDNPGQDIYISDFCIDYQWSKFGLQYLYLVSERGDIFFGTITWTPLTISFQHVGKCFHPIEKCLFLPTSNKTSSFIGCFGSLCDGSAVLVYENKHILNLDPPFIIPNSAPVSDCFYFKPNDNKEAEKPGILGSCFVTLTKRKESGALNLYKFGVKVSIKSDYMILDESITGIWPISFEGIDCLVLSFVNETRIFKFLEPALIDYTDKIGLVDSVATLAVFKLEEGIVQVLKTGIHVSLYSTEDSYSSFSKSMDTSNEGEIISSAIYDNYVFLVFKSSVLIVKILVDSSALAVSFINIRNMELGEQISCVYICANEVQVPFPICFMGITSAIKLFKISLLLDSDSNIPWRVIPILSASSETSSFDIPQSISFLSSNEKVYLIVANIIGELLVFDWEILNSDVYVSPVSRYCGFSNLPITLVRNDFSNELLAISDKSPFKIVIGKYGMEFEAILLDRAIQAAALPLENHYLMALTNKTLAIVELNPQCSIVSQTLVQKNLPIKIAFDPLTGNYLVITSSKSTHSETRKSVINLVDPASNQLLAAKIISDHENIECLTIWNVKQKRYICIGTSGHQNSRNLGRVLCFTIKTSKKQNLSAHKFILLSELEFRYPVNYIAPAENYLFVSSGSDLNQVKINAESRQMMIGARCSSRNPANSIKTTSDFDVFLAGSQDSLCHFRYLKDIKKIELVAADDIPKRAVDCWVIQNNDDQTNLVICIFSSGTVAGYRCENHKIELLFSFSIMDLPLKIFPMIFEKQHSNLAQNELDISIDFQPFDIPWGPNFDEPLVIITKANARCTMLRISDDMYLLLKKLQDIMQFQPATKPFLGGNINTRYKNECGDSKNALDIDFLYQFLILDSSIKQSIFDQFESAFQFRDVDGVSRGEKSLSTMYLDVKDIENIIYRFYRKLS